MTESTTYAADLLKRMEARLHEFADSRLESDREIQSINRIGAELKTISDSDESRHDELDAELDAILTAQQKTAVRSLAVQLLAADGELLYQMGSSEQSGELEAASSSLQSTLCEMLRWLARAEGRAFKPGAKISPSEIAGLLAEPLGWDESDVSRFAGALGRDEFDEIVKTFHDGETPIALELLEQAKRRAISRNYETGVQDALIPEGEPDRWDEIEYRLAMRWLLLWGCAQWVVDDFLMLDELDGSDSDESDSDESDRKWSGIFSRENPDRPKGSAIH